MRREIIWRFMVGLPSVCLHVLHASGTSIGSAGSVAIEESAESWAAFLVSHAREPVKYSKGANPQPHFTLNLAFIQVKTVPNRGKFGVISLDRRLLDRLSSARFPAP